MASEQLAGQSCKVPGKIIVIGDSRSIFILLPNQQFSLSAAKGRSRRRSLLLGSALCRKLSVPTDFA